MLHWVINQDDIQLLADENNKFIEVQLDQQVCQAGELPEAANEKAGLLNVERRVEQEKMNTMY